MRAIFEQFSLLHTLRMRLASKALRLVGTLSKLMLWMQLLAL